jgi:hypothetical protein
METTGQTPVRISRLIGPSRWGRPEILRLEQDDQQDDDDEQCA